MRPLVCVCTCADGALLHQAPALNTWLNNNLDTRHVAAIIHLKGGGWGGGRNTEQIAKERRGQAGGGGGGHIFVGEGAGGGGGRGRVAGAYGRRAAMCWQAASAVPPSPESPALAPLLACVL